MSRVRVLRIIGRLNMGGPAHQAALLSGRRFHPDRYETLLVHGNIPASEASLADLAEEEGATMRFVPALQQPVHPARDPRALFELIRIARDFKPDIVHTHTAKAGFLGRQAALAVSPRPAIVHTYHGHVLEGYFSAAKTRVYRGLERIMARFSDRLIGVSQATVDDLVRLGVAPRDRFTVVPLGLDLAPLAALDDVAGLRRRLRAEMRLEDDDVLLLFVGRVVPIKRLDVLLEGLANTRESASARNLHLAIVGDGDMRPRLERQAEERGIADAVHFLGYRRELHPILSAADIAVISSDNEGTPVSLIEAAAAGLPAVATDVGGVREVVTEETGIVVPPRDPPALGAALVALASDDKRRAACGGAARTLALDRYGAERLLGDIDGLYRELVTA